MTKLAWVALFGGPLYLLISHRRRVRHLRARRLPGGRRLRRRASSSSCFGWTTVGHPTPGPTTVPSSERSHERGLALRGGRGGRRGGRPRRRGGAARWPGSASAGVGGVAVGGARGRLGGGAPRGGVVGARIAVSNRLNASLVSPASASAAPASWSPSPVEDPPESRPGARPGRSGTTGTRAARRSGRWWWPLPDVGVRLRPAAAHRGLHPVRHVPGNAARSGLHQPALEIAERVAPGCSLILAE